MIRICAKITRFNYDLRTSPLYTIARYEFDDDVPGSYTSKLPGSCLFTEDLAARILRDFQERGSDKETLLVHCLRGENRSPAVGIALNEIFHLGHDTAALKRKYPHLNQYIYDTLLKFAKNSP